MSEPSGDLLRRSQAGDASALDALLARHLPGVRAFTRLRMGPLVRAHAASMDLVQSACVELLQKGSDFEYRGEEAFRAWLYSAVAHKIQERHRHLTAQKRDVRRHEAPARAAAGDDGGADAWARCYAAVLSPSQELIAGEEVQRMEAAFDALPEAYREVIALSRIARLSRREVAQQMQRTEASVRNLLPRALVALAEAMDGASGTAAGDS